MPLYAYATVARTHMPLLPTYEALQRQQRDGIRHVKISRHMILLLIRHVVSSTRRMPLRHAAASHVATLKRRC